MTDLPKRAWLLPGGDCGIWKAENNGSAEMVGAVEYVPVSELERLEALMGERSQMLQSYNRMLKETAAREENWKALYLAALKGDKHD